MAQEAHAEVPECEREKAHVGASDKPKALIPTYAIGSKAKYRVQEEGIDGKLRWKWKTFVVTACDRPRSEWQYKLKDELTGGIQNKGNFIPESQLEDPDPEP